MAFVPNLSTLPAPQLALWPDLGATPDTFTLYGGTALALRLGHRSSVDFGFFSNTSFDPERLASTVPFLRGAERLQVAPNTLTCRVERDGPVWVSFFGDLGLGLAAAHERVSDVPLNVASLLDLAGTKATVVQKRAEIKDYLDVDALLRHGIDLPTMLAAAAIIYGSQFNPLITLKALSYFDDLPDLPAAVRARLRGAVDAVDTARLPVLTAYAARPQASEI